MKKNIVKNLMIILSMMSFQLQAIATIDGGGSQGPTEEGPAFLQIGHDKPTVEDVRRAEQTCREKILEMHAKSINGDLIKESAISPSFDDYRYFYTRTPLKNNNKIGACWVTNKSIIKDNDNVFDSVSNFLPKKNSKNELEYITIKSYTGNVPEISDDKKASVFSGDGCGSSDSDFTRIWYTLVTNTIPTLVYTPVENFEVDPTTHQPTRKDDIADNLQILNREGVDIAFYNVDAYEKLKITTPLFTYPRAEYVQCLQSELTSN